MDFAWAIAFACMMADFQNALISRIFSVFSTRFLEFKFLSQSEDFAWAIAFALIFKMLSFLQYLLFFGAVFCREQLEMICKMDFDMFFGILIFEPK